MIESANVVGGLAGTLRENGYCMDVGPHSLFSEDKEILDIILNLFDNTLIAKPRQVKFYLKALSYASYFFLFLITTIKNRKPDVYFTVKSN